MDNQNTGNLTNNESVLLEYLSSRKRQMTFRVFKIEIPTRTVLLAN